MMTDTLAFLTSFYSRPLGQRGVEQIGSDLARLWPNVRGDVVVGLGYATPYLAPFLGTAQRVLSLVVAGHHETVSCKSWPRADANLVACVTLDKIPLPDMSVDNLLLVHALERAESPRALIRECWRVMADGGSLVIVVPNRRGLWARSEKTPFGIGTPYTRGQLDGLLRDSLFTPQHWRAALFSPPLGQGNGVWRRSVDHLAQRLMPEFSGVLVMDARKQRYAGTACSQRGFDKEIPARWQPVSPQR